MAFEKITIQTRNVEARLKAFDSNKDIDTKEMKDVKEFLRLCELGRINKGKKISQSRLLKYLDILRIPFVYFKKDTTKLTLKEVEQFDTDLSKDKIRNKQTGKPLSQNSKVDVRKMFKIYLKWKLRNNLTKFTTLTDWWDTTYKSKTPDYLEEKEIVELLGGCKNKAERFLICVLFDSGARIQEFLNLRLTDITEPTKEFPYYMLDFKEEYSKMDNNGKGRGKKIGMYWKHSEKTIREYVKTLETKKDTLLFENTYDSIRFFLNRLARRVLGRGATPHLFRHSSATYYANKMNRQELCIRYGWSFTSRMPDTYIARAGVEQKQIMETFKARGMDKFREENEELKQQVSILHLKFKELEQIEKFVPLLKAIESNEKVIGILNKEMKVKK